MLLTLLINSLKYVLSLTDRNDIYTKYARFRGLKGPVNCLEFSPNGALLASGGDNEIVQVWDVSSKKCSDVLEDNSGRWGQITCLTWLNGMASDETKRLAFGTARGLTVIYCQNRINTAMVELSSTRVFDPSDPVEAMQYNDESSRLAITSHHGNISIYEVGRNGTMLRLWTAAVNNAKNAYIARSIAFYDSGRKVLIFVLETGEMICRDVDSGQEEWRKVLQSGIGHASLCPDGRLLVVENLAKGFDLYQMPRSSPSQSFLISSRKKCVKDGVFAEGASSVVCGSDHGRIYVFSTSSSVPIQIMKQGGRKTEVQTICTTSAESRHLIASGTSLESSDIVIWEKRPKRSDETTVDRDTNFGVITTVLNVLFVCAIAYWTSGYWTPIALQTTRGAINAMNAVVDVRHTPPSHASKVGFTAWDSRSVVDIESDEDEDDDKSWSKIESDYLTRWNEL